MSHKKPWFVSVGLAALLVLGLLASGCGGPKKAAQTAVETGGSQVSPTEERSKVEEPTEAAEPTEAVEPTAESGGTSEEQVEEIDSALDNLLKLAPVHLVSSFEHKEGDKVITRGRLEGDVDAQGNQHLVLYDADGNAVEIYVVGDTLYIGTEEGQFVPMEGLAEDGHFGFLALYGGTYLLAYNDLRDARRLGSESVNGYQCDRYQIKYDLAAAGISGVAAEAQGAEWEFQSLAWVEQNTKALVRARVDWKGKSAGSDTLYTHHSEFDATPGTVQEIKAPENVLRMGG